MRQVFFFSSFSVSNCERGAKDQPVLVVSVRSAFWFVYTMSGGVDPASAHAQQRRVLKGIMKNSPSSNSNSPARYSQCYKLSITICHA